MEFKDLSLHILEVIIKDLTLEQLNSLCSLNPELEEKICKNEAFWEQKYRQKFGFPEIVPLIWREAYRQRLYNQLYLFGDRTLPTNTSNYNIQSISAGYDHGLILTIQGQIYAFGSNEYGQLGLEEYLYSSDLELISFGLKPKEKAISISAGDHHNLILTEQEKVYAFGENRYGQLGLGDRLNKFIPAQIPLGEKIQSISAGGAHSLILTKQGKVYAFGFNEYGQLGLGDQELRLSPEIIPIEEKIISISAGWRHSLILTEQKQVYVFGSNSTGQLGLGDLQNRFRAEILPFEGKITAISAGSSHSLILTNEGQVYAFGRGVDGELGLGFRDHRSRPQLIPIKEKIISISAGRGYSLILTNEGQTYAFGSNRYGELGLGDRRERINPELIPIENKIISISAGNIFSLILTGVDTLYSSIETLIQNDWVKEYELKYWTSENTGVVEFIDIQDQSYLIEVIYDPETKQIHELK